MREQRNEGMGNQRDIVICCWEHFASAMTERDLKGKEKGILKAALLGRTYTSGGSSLQQEFYL